MKADKTLTSIPSKYADFADFFFKDLMAKLLEHITINDYVINLIKCHQSQYRLIYSLKPVEFKTLKIYIEINLANRFIKSSKSPIGTLIFFVKKLDKSFGLYINYKRFTNLIMKSQYPLVLINESLDWLSYAKHFI